MSQELPHLLFRMTVSGSAVRPVALTKVFNWAELCATVMATACDSHHFILIKPLSDPLCPCVEASAFIKHSQWRDISHLAEVVIKRLSAHLRQTHWIWGRRAAAVPFSQAAWDLCRTRHRTRTSYCAIVESSFSPWCASGKINSDNSIFHVLRLFSHSWT